LHSQRYPHTRRLSDCPSDDLGCAITSYKYGIGDTVGGLETVGLLDEEAIAGFLSSERLLLQAVNRTKSEIITSIIEQFRGCAGAFPNPLSC
jgi:hypothetical protein